MEENNIDKYFKEALKEHTEAPSAEVWSQIDATLAPENDDAAAPFYWRGLALLSLGLLFLISGLFYWRMEKLDQENVALEQKLAQERYTPLSTEDKGFTEQATIEPIPSKTQDLPSTGAIGATASHEVNNEQSISSAKTDVVESEVDEALKSSNLSTLLSNKSEESNPSEDIDLLAKGLGKKIGTLGIQDLKGAGDINSAKKGLEEAVDMALIDPMPFSIASIRSENGLDTGLVRWPNCGFKRFDEFHEEPRWRVGIAAFQNSSYRRVKALNREGNADRQQLNRIEKPGSSLGLRGYLACPISKRLSISLGLDYSQWKQSGTYIITYTLSMSDLTTTAPILQWIYDNETLTSSGIATAQLDDLIGASTLAIEGINPEQTQEVPIDIQESIQWLSIPLTLSYQTQQGRWGLQSGAGLSYDALLGNNLESNIEGKKSRSKPDKSRSGYISVQAEAGLFYRINERMKVHAGARFKSWLIPLQESDAFRTYPYSNAIEVGIEIGL